MCYLSLKDRLSITEQRLYLLHLITFHHNLLITPRSEAESALLVWSWVVEQRSHVWPLLPGGELLPPKCQEDHHHPPAAGRCAPPGRGPQWTAAQDERPSVSQKQLHEKRWGCFLIAPGVKFKCGSWHKLLLSRVIPIKPTEMCFHFISPIFRSNTHPDLQLWRQPWKHLERPRACSDSCRGSDAAPSPVTPDEDMSRGEILMSNALEKLSRAATAAASSSSCSSSPFPSFQDSYITSEHCYQKPRAYYPAVEQRLVVETRQGSELEDSMRSTEELLEREQRYGSLLETDKPKATGTSYKVGRYSTPDTYV